MTVPIASDPEVLERIYQQFHYLRDHPLDLKGSWLDEAESLGVLGSEDGEFLAFLLGYRVNDEGPHAPVHHPFLSPEENRSLRYYRHLAPVQPWPQPTIGVVLNQDAGAGSTGLIGHTTGIRCVDVVLKKIGNVQLWWGGEVAVLWEAFFEAPSQARADHEFLLHQLWRCCEQYLEEQGVIRIYTLGRDPAVNDAFYRGFLKERGYVPSDEGPAVVKAVG